MIILSIEAVSAIANSNNSVSDLPLFLTKFIANNAKTANATNKTLKVMPFFFILFFCVFPFTYCENDTSENENQQRWDNHIYNSNSRSIFFDFNFINRMNFNLL